MQILFHIPETMKKFFIFIASLVLVALVGYVDHATGTYLDFFLFYLIPVYFAAWFCGVVPGMIISVACTVSWFIADDVGDLNHLVFGVLVWNLIIRTAIFAVVSYTLCWIHSHQRKRKEFIEFIVHDMRTPLAVVSLGLMQLNKCVCGTALEGQQDILKACRSAVVRLSTLVNAFLDVARIESNMLTPVITPWTVTGVLDLVLEETSILAVRQDIKLTKDVILSDETIYSDQDILTRVLTNLVSNALKVSGPGTSVTIRVEAEAHGKVRFSVIDQGPGIPKKMLRKVFGRFSQLRKDDRPVMAGSGLGLNYCKMAVRQLKGYITINSEIGRGTDISFVIPSAKPRNFSQAKTA